MINIADITSGLKLGKDGIWHSRDKNTISYPSEGNEMCFAVEENSFWFNHRNRCIVSVLKSIPPKYGKTIFDIGGGNGFVSLAIANAGFDVVLVEPGPVGARNAKLRGVQKVICSTAEDAKFSKGSLPAAGLFDVIEHIDNDAAFLKRIKSLMVSGGLIYATVPSYQCLWSEEDELGGHFRRYTLKSISKTFDKAGLNVKFSTYIFRFLPVPIFLFRKIPYKMGLAKRKPEQKNLDRDHVTSNSVFRYILEKSLSTEVVNLSKLSKMSFGASCLIVAECP